MTNTRKYGNPLDIDPATGLGTDYGAECETPIAPLDDRLDRDLTHRPISVEEWCDFVGVWPPLIPFASRGSAVLEIIPLFRAGFDTAPPTKATVTLGDWRADKPSLSEVDPLPIGSSGAGRLAKRIFPFLGSWRISTYSERPARWVNPQYVHLHTQGVDPRWEDDPNVEVGPSAAARNQVIRQWAWLAVHDRDAVADRLGIDHGALDEWCVEHDLEWDRWRRDGKARLARTIRLICAWTGRTEHDIATTLGLPESSARGWTTRFVDEAGWAPPTDPSCEKWFTLHHSAGTIAADGGAADD